MAKHSTRRSSRPLPARTGPAATPVSAGRQLHTTVAALHTGATAMATLGGLALYTWLAQAHVATPLAIVAGFIFALLGRIAAISLGREWLVRAAVRHRTRSTAAPPTEPQRR